MYLVSHVKKEKFLLTRTSQLSSVNFCWVIKFCVVWYCLDGRRLGQLWPLYFNRALYNSRDWNQSIVWPDWSGLVEPFPMPPNTNLAQRQSTLCHRLGSFVHLGPRSFSDIIVVWDPLFIARYQYLQKWLDFVSSQQRFLDVSSV